MTRDASPRTIAVLTSGGDAPGMNAAVRAVVRTALARGARVFAIHEGYEGAVAGDTCIRPMGWSSVAGLLGRGGTAIGTARSERFRTREGRLAAAANLVTAGIDSLVVIGGDGSLSGADVLRREWGGLLDELVRSGRVERATAEAALPLSIAGLPGSIDNDLAGTDITIGADTALHRITEAIDAISSTAASHQRTFVVEVMGRNCGYLALMGAIAAGANWVLLPEDPPAGDWASTMCDRLARSRRAGRRASIVVVAEGARDRDGQPIGATRVRDVLEERLGEDVRVTILGHVQRGGAPTAFDRYLSTLLGHAAVEELLRSAPGSEPQLVGMRNNRVCREPLVAAVERTREVGRCLDEGRFADALALRGPGFAAAWTTFKTLARALPRTAAEGRRRHRLMVLHAGGPAPGMNTAVRAALRLALDRGHHLIGARNSFSGLRDGDVFEMGWMTVNGWASLAAAQLGTNRHELSEDELPAVARRLEEHRVDGILMIGGWAGYRNVLRLHAARERWPAFRIPMICLPASIDNNLPGSELSIGSDTALNSVVTAVDRIRTSAVASRRCFVVEVMGRRCGYLALMSGLASGAEKAYLPEDGITLGELQRDIVALRERFRSGLRVGLMMRSEAVSPFYTTPFLCALFEQEAEGLFDVRPAVLGHLQQGGEPSPFDRNLATRMAAECVSFLADEADGGGAGAAAIGFREARLARTPVEELPPLMDEENHRPRDQWWRALEPIAAVVAGRPPAPDAERGA